MKKICIKFLNSLVFLFLASLAQAAQNTSLDGLKLNGIASYEKLRKEHYLAALYLEEQSNFPDYVLAMPGKKVMDIRITADSWSARSFNSTWTEALLINNDEASQSANKEVILAFGKLLKGDLKKGDQISIVYIPDIGSSVILNQATLLTTADEGLFNLLANTWIGPRPFSSDFKRDLLNLNSDSSTAALIKRHSEIIADSKRIAETAAWAPKQEQEKAELAKNEAAAAPKALAGMPPSDDTSVRATVERSDKTVAAKLASEKVASEKPSVAKPVIEKPVLAAPKPAVAVAKPVIEKPAAAAPAPKPVTPAAAPPAPEAVAAAPAAKPAPAANSADKLLKSYRATVLKQTYRNTKYPERSINLKQEGLIVLKLRINREGKVINIVEEQTSEFSSLNKAAEVAVKRSQPYPAPPDELAGDSFDVSVPFNFKL